MVTGAIPLVTSSNAPGTVMSSTTTISNLPEPYFLSRSSCSQLLLVASLTVPRTL